MSDRFCQSSQLQIRPETETRRLRALVREGSLNPSRVRLAAYLGNPAACRVLGKQPWFPSLPDQSPWHARRSLRGWLEGLRGWGKEAWVRAALSCAELALPDWERRNPQDPTPRQALEAATRWLCCPCEEHARQAGAAVRAAAHARLDFSACSALRAAQAAATDGMISLAHAITGAEDAAWVVSSPLAVQTAIRSALIPWSLGYTRLHLAGLRVA